MVKVRGRNLNGKTVKQTVKNGRKISGDDAARPAWVPSDSELLCQATAVRGCVPILINPEFDAALDRDSCVTHWMSSPGSALWYTDIWQSFFFFFVVVVSWVLFDKKVTEYRVWHKVQRKKFDVILRFLVDRYRRTKPPKPNASQFVVPARLPKPVIGSGGLSSSRFDDDVPEVNCTWTASFSWRVKEAAFWFESYGSKNLTGGTTWSSQSTSTDWLTRTHHWSSPRSKLAYKKPTSTVILQNFGVVLFSVFSVVNGFTEIKKTPKWEKYMEWSRQHPRTPKFKLNRTLRACSPPKF